MLTSPCIFMFLNSSIFSTLKHIYVTLHSYVSKWLLSFSGNNIFSSLGRHWCAISKVFLKKEQPVSDGIVFKCVSKEENRLLEEFFGDWEIKEVVWSCDGIKSWGRIDLRLIFWSIGWMWLKVMCSFCERFSF